MEYKRKHNQFSVLSFDRCMSFLGNYIFSHHETLFNRFSLTLLFSVILFSFDVASAQLRCESLFSSSPVTARETTLNVIKHGNVNSIILVKSLKISDPEVTITSVPGKLVLNLERSADSKITVDIPLTIEAETLAGWQFGSSPVRSFSPNNLSEATLLKDYNYRKIPLSTMAVAEFRELVIDSKSLFKYASINFVVSGGENRTAGKVYLESDFTKALSEKYSKKIFYETDVAIPGKASDWISLRLSEFRLNDPQLKYPLHTTPQTPNKLSIEFSADQIKKSGAKEITIAKYMNIDLDMGKDVAVLVDKIHFYGGPNELGRFFGFKKSVLFGEERDVNRHGQEIRNNLKKFFKNMEKPENQQFAVDLVRKGLPSVNRELEQYGWKATKALNGKARFADVITSLGERNLFYESGDFAVVHGRLTHHAQILAGLHGLTFAERMEAMDFIGDYIGSLGQAGRWPLWTALFDSRADGVTSSRYWRDLVYK